MARSDKWTAYQKTPEYYSDFTNNFDLNPQTGFLAILTNENAVKNSIRNLVLTNKFERFYQPMVGSKVQSLTFDPNDNATIEMLASTINETISNFEPRAINPQAQVTSFIDDNTIAITITFGLMNVPQPIIFPLILKRVR